MRYLRLFVLFFSLFLSSCVVITDPLTGKKTFTLITKEQEIQMGRSYLAAAIEEGQGRYPDTRVQNYINRLGWKIAKHVPRKFNYKFYVVNSGQVNAFAIPGGYIFVNRGLILVLDNESQLAGVIGHELAHINARHHARYMEKMLGATLLYQVFGSLVKNSKYRDVLLQLGGLGVGLISLKWSREQEQEADRYGVRFTYLAGYDPRGLLETFRIFEKLGHTNQPEWLLSHPLPKNRYAYVSSLIKQLPPKPSLKRDSKEFHEIKNILLKTKPSFDYYDKAIKAIRNKNVEQAMYYLNKAITLFPKNMPARTLRAYLYIQTKRYNLAVKDAVYVCKLDSMYFSPHLFAGYAYLYLKNYPSAIKYLTRAKQLIPNFPDTYYLLGLAYEAMKDYRRALENYKMALKLTNGKRGWEQDAKRRIQRLQRLMYR